MIADGIKDDAQSSDITMPCNVISAGSPAKILPQFHLLSLAQLFDKATDAEGGAIHANQEEILRWYYYGKEFLIQASVIVQDDQKKQDCVYQKSPVKLARENSESFQEIIDNFSKQEDECPTSEISAGGSCQNSIIVKTNQTDASEAQERSLVYSATPATSNIYDETAKWGETYYYDDETDDWGTPYEDDDRGYYLNLNTGEIRRKETSAYA
ncbi:hypothetical protein RhiirA1_465466 [Rhizophagus irregularis]|uniref:Uncharacterized protein n=1 Tax=Rhizophagus irregularis TaxID=588596 RepID=A0A2N0RFY2_9GLOM|nr:hypothetical protein RhiirA1_465466 [Rhizophagus irregularis]